MDEKIYKEGSDITLLSGNSELAEENDTTVGISISNTKSGV